MMQSTPKQPEGLLISFECRAERHGDTWLAACNALGISDQGSTWGEAKARMFAALRLFFNDCSERGVLEDVLRKRKVPFAKIPMPSLTSVDRLKKKIRLLTELGGESIHPDDSLVEQLEVLVPANEMGKVNARFGAD